MFYSENTSRADNQQERLMMIGWITGFVDGEGCFSVGFIQQPDRQETFRIRRGYRIGYQVWAEFAVTQGEKSLASLDALQKYFGVGYVRKNTRHDNHKEHLYNYSVRKVADLTQVIIPFFQRYPLRTAKQKDFEKFVQCVEIIQRKEHLTIDGAIKIAQIATTMNRRKPRQSLIRILRYHTPTL